MPTLFVAACVQDRVAQGVIATVWRWITGRAPKSWVIVQTLTTPRVSRIEEVLPDLHTYMPVVKNLCEMQGGEVLAITVWLPDDMGGEVLSHLPYRLGERPVRNPNSEDGGFRLPALKPGEPNPNVMS